MNGKRASTATFVIIISVLLVSSSFSSYTFSPATDNFFLFTVGLSLIQPAFAGTPEEEALSGEYLSQSDFQGRLP